MEFHGIDMAGPLNTDNIRALDGTLAATIDDTTGKVNFQDDVDIADGLDVQGDSRVFQNLEVQGPLASFLQSISVGVDAAITGDLTVGVDANVGNDLDVTRFLTVGNRTETVNLRMTGGGPAAGFQVQAADALGNLEYGGLPSIPTGAIILFDSNTVITGYSLLTDQDDDVVYITKGTAAGGEAGGQPKVGGVWSHNHGVIGVTFAHNHQWYDGNKASWQSNGSTKVGVASGLTGHTTNGLFGRVTSANGNSSTVPMYTKDSTASASGNTDNNTTWRPKGRNFTRQQRN